MFSRRNLAHAFIHLVAWLAAGVAISALFSDSPSHYAYGLLSGWWAALYVGFMFGVGLWAAIPSIVVFLTLVLIDSIAHLGLFHDSPPLSLELLLFAMPALAIYLSPIFVNWAVRATMKRWQRA